MKKCSGAGCRGKLRPTSEFSKDTKRKGGLFSQCKACKAEYDHSRYQNNRNEILVRNKSYYEANKEERGEWYREYSRSWYRANKERRRESERTRRQENVNTRLAHNLRDRVNKSIRRNQKSGSAVRDLGCSIGELKLYLENYFPLYPGMSWENYGEWHIDHVMPLSGFDLEDRTQFLEACHYTNLQPLWSEENQKKSNKI